MNEQAVSIDSIFDPEFWRNERKYGGCVKFVLDNFGLLLESANHLNPRIMKFAGVGDHFYLELDTLERDDRFIIDPERAVNPHSHLFYVGRLKDCNHQKEASYLTAYRAEEMGEAWGKGIRI